MTCDCAVLYVGKKIYGYCNGYFGRDSYSDKTIVAHGATWITVLDIDGYASSTNFESHERMIEKVKEWGKEPVNDPRYE